MEMLNAFIDFINSASGTDKWASLAFFVSVLSAIYSRRAIILSQRAEKRSAESEANAKKLRTIEKQTEITSLLNEALIDLSKANTSMKLCRLSLPNLIDFYSNNISNPLRQGIIWK